MLIKHALERYNTEHLDTLRTGAERHRQLDRFLTSMRKRHMHEVTNADLSDRLAKWKGGTRNRYRAALTHFWKYGRAHGWCDLHPTLMGGKEKPRDAVLSLDQLRSLYHAAPRQGDAWMQFGQLLILTGQRTGDLMRFDPRNVTGQDMHLQTSKNGQSHIVPLNGRAFVLAAMMPNQFHDKATTAHFKRRWFKSAFVPMSFRLHDIRRSFATHLCEHGENEADVDRILNHVASQTSTGVARIYNRSKRLPQRRAIMDRWERMLFG